GPAEVVLLPGLVSGGKFAGFGAPIRLASAKGPLDVSVADVDSDGAPDAVVVDRDGVLIIRGKQSSIVSNDTPQAARDLGSVVHLAEPTLTITPGHQDAWYRLRVPDEAFPGAGNQMIDFSGGFTNEEGAGLRMEVVKASGEVVGSGERFRIVAKQRETLFVHVF